MGWNSRQQPPEFGRPEEDEHPQLGAEDPTHQPYGTDHQGFFIQSQPPSGFAVGEPPHHQECCQHEDRVGVDFNRPNLE
jgi:hypothetical protein